LVDKIIQNGAKRAYLQTDSKRYFAESFGVETTLNSYDGR